MIKPISSNISVMLPDGKSIDNDWLTFLIPAYRGQVEITVKILYVHIESAVSGLKDEEDVKAFLDAHKPYLGIQYHGYF